MPRATTAACEVIPPRAVRIPWAACIPRRSSGEVSRRTRITFSPFSAHSSACSAKKTILPEAAPGEAGSPSAIVLALESAAFSNTGCSSSSSFSGSTRSTAVFSSISPSDSMSIAIFTMALPVRFPERVCSIQRRPSCTVNSMSCISW